MPDNSVIPVLDSRPFKALCGTGYTPLKMTGIFQMWLIQHFSNRNNIVELGLRDRLWNQDPELSKIQILPLEDWRPNQTEQRPSLIIKPQEWKHVRFGIDNRLIGGTGVYATKRQYSSGMQGSHTIFCIAGEGAETSQLAAEVFNELIRFSSVVREWLNLLKLELVSISELSKLEEASENFVVAVNIAYAFLQEWELLSLDDLVLVGSLNSFT